MVYGFLGPNGAGKTTTMRLLTGLIHPDGGTIEVLGKPFGRSDRRRLFEVGALVESPAFYPYLTGRANLRALAASGAPTPKGRIEEVLELVGLRERGDDKVSNYSLGMKQRLGIAGALLSDPRLLLLDEPANGLDPAGIVAMRDTLRHLASTGKTVFISSHLLAEVSQLADVIGIIAAGKLVREGPIETLLSGEGRVRVRVEPDEVGRAVAALAPLGDCGPARWLRRWAAERSRQRSGLAGRPHRHRPGGRSQPDPGSGRDLRLGNRDRQRPRIALPRADLGSPGGRAWRRAAAGARELAMRLFVSTLAKLRSRLATGLTLGLLILLMALIYLAVGATAKQVASRPNGAAALELLTFPGAYAFIFSFVLALGGLFVMAYAAAIAGSEWTWGTLKTSVARGESRSRYMLTTYAGIALLAGVGMLVAFGAGVLLAFLGAKLAGVSTDGISDTSIFGNLPEQFLRGWFGLIEVGAIGFTIATLARSQLAGVGAGIGIYFAEMFAGAFLPDIVKYLPFNAANSLIQTDTTLGGGSNRSLAVLDPNTAVVVVAAWIVVGLVVTAVFTERAEISG